MRLPTPPGLPSALAACAASALIFATGPNLGALAAPPTPEALATLRKGYQAAADGLLPNADSLLTKSIGEWRNTAQPADELSALYKVRSSVRQQQGRDAEALADLDEAVVLLEADSAKPDPAEVQRTILKRARVNAALKRWVCQRSHA